MSNPTANALRYSAIIALGGFVFGFDASVISGVVGYVTRSFDLSPIQQGMVVSAPTLTAVLASFTVGFVTDYFGRKRTLQFLAILFAVSAVYSALASDYWSLVAARAIGGYAFGSLYVAPVYIAELSPARLRGRLVSVNQLNIVLGLSTAYFTNYLIQNLATSELQWVSAVGLDTYTWNWMLGIEAVPALIWLFLLSFVPRSPRWLATTGRWSEAEAVLQRTNEPAEVNTALNDIRAMLGEATLSVWGRLRELVSPKMAYILTIGILIAVIQQITGINIVFFYATTIFEQSGVGTDAAFAQAVSIGLVNIVFTLIAMATIDSIGRKPLMIVGLVGVTVSMSTVGYGFYKATYEITPEGAKQLAEQVDPALLAPVIGVRYKSDVAFKRAVAEVIGDTQLRDNEAAILNVAMSANARLILVGILGFVAAFAVSLGPVMWVLLSEIFPVRIRGLAISLVTVFNSGSSWFVQFIFPWEIANIGSAGVFFSFAGFAAIGLVLVAWVLPETKGQSLEQLEEKLVRP